jgi:hypothetical protein
VLQTPSERETMPEPGHMAEGHDIIHALAGSITQGEFL